MKYKIIADTPMGKVVIGWCNKDTLPLHGFARYGYTNVRLEKIEERTETVSMEIAS
jgi:hypothetical protein